MSALWILPPLALVAAALAVHLSSRQLREELGALQASVASWRPVAGEAARLRADVSEMGAIRRREPRR